MPESVELTGWGQIADYLGVSPRTAQVYEREQGLPVRRRPGSKGRVWAVSKELDAWKSNTPPNDVPAGVAVSPSKSSEAGTRLEDNPSIPEGGQSPPASPIEDLTMPPSARGVRAGKIEPPTDQVGQDRRQWLRKVAFGGAALSISGTGLALAAFRLLRPASIPTAYRIEGATFIVLGKDGREVWRHEFSRRLEGPFYTATTARSCIFADLDRDGQVETLFNCYPEGDAPEPYLICFDDRGKLLWEFHPSGTVSDTEGREFLPPYFVSDFEVVPLGKGHQSKIVVACHHHFSFPTQVVMLDYRGTLLSRYWHRGHLLHVAVADLDGSGEPTVLLGGVNDGADYKQATLVILDHRSCSGGSVSPNGTPYFSGIDRDTEKIEMFFPKTRISERKEFNRVNYVGLRQNRILVCITEDIVEADPRRVVYELDFYFNVTAVAFADSIRTEYVEIFGDSRKAEEAVRQDEERCRSEVRVIRRT